MFAEKVEGEDEGALSFRPGWDLLEGLQTAGWRDPVIAAAFARDLEAPALEPVPGPSSLYT